MHVLVADDHQVTLELLELHLTKWGHTVTTAQDGQEAWRQLRRQDIDLAIIDWVMPGLTGLELCRKIREGDLEKYVYIILLTSRDDREDLLKGLGAEADDYVTKPFDQEVLRLRIRAGERVIELQSQLRSTNRDLADLNRQLEEWARTDGLTGLFNRRNFDETIIRFHDRAIRYGEAYGVIMCDVDHFKLYNDTYGHVAGDLVLRTIGSAVQETTRVSDQVFRYGGEELAVIAPGQDITGAVRVAERMREAVRGLDIEHESSPVPFVTISCGVAVFEGESSAEGLKVLERADAALYRAKQEGRDRVTIG